MLLTGILQVLKIIGIVLLAILGIVLLLILLVMFVPVRYRVDATVPESGFDAFSDIKNSGVSASARFSWLWFVLRGGIDFPKDNEFYLKVFGIKILPKKESKKTEDKVEESEGKVEEKTEEPVQDVNENGEEKSDGTEAEASTETGVTTEEETSVEAEISTEAETDEEIGQDHPLDEEAEDEEEKTFLDVLWNIIDSIDNFLKTPLNVFEKIQYTISRVCDKIDMIKATLDNDIFKRAFEVSKKRFLRILRMILPDKCDIRLLLGLSDPATTAEIFAVYSTLYPILVKKVKFQPDFQREVVGADVHLKGHITIFTIVYCAAVWYFNKDVKKTIRRFKKILKS